MTSSSKINREQIKRERRRQYGDPIENMTGTAKHLTALLTPWAKVLSLGGDLPPQFGAYAGLVLKFNRLRLGYWQDTFDDLHNYLDFAEKLQQGSHDPSRALAEVVETRLRGRHRVYVAGPYTAPDAEGVNHNVQQAAMASAEVMRRGHFAHCPHAATHPVSLMLTNDPAECGGDGGYETWMELDRQIIDSWATAICVIGMSPGVERELEQAKTLGLTIFHGSRAVPDVTDRF